ncbi:MAG: hypothetical protein COX48_01160 [bacterium (Candidatus Stahlbacteria) CG23_combo_of_CG06-09_8_20_14_all_34_7]|nr:MAG: hypothetical protein COX48_01160 [bacterium (Candidatus Stahlbacteria) CG23_combo_of_CG06-09_8_20_14_all_34_7]
MNGEIRSKDDIPNIMGFITQTEKNGILSLSNKTDKIEVGFINGSVNAAVYHRGGTQELIKEYLVNSGKISKDEFKKTLEIHKETRLPLEKILFDEKHITQEQWSDIIQFKIQEVFDELFTWTEGIYEFIEDVIMYPKSSVRMKINTQALMMEGMRRIDEWPNIKILLPNTNIYFKVIDNASIPANLGTEENRLVQIISPDKSLEELIKISGLGKFLTYQSVYNLLKMNLIVKTKKDKFEETIPNIPKVKKINKRILLNWLILFSVTLILIATGVFSRQLFKKVITMGEVKYQASDAYNLENMDYLLRIYFIKYRKFPDNINELVKLNWVKKDDIDNLFYLRTDDGYVIKPLND